MAFEHEELKKEIDKLQNSINYIGGAYGVLFFHKLKTSEPLKTLA